MLYRHTKRFQAVLQLALRVARLQRGYDHARILEEAGIPATPHDTLDRFLRAKLSHYLTDISGESEVEVLGGQFVRVGIAKALWDVCESKGYLSKALSDAGVTKSALYNMREAANAIHCLLNSHESRQNEIAERGLEGSFICYKKSFKYRGHVVKSKVTIKLKNKEYFDFTDIQVGTGRFQPARDEEISRGFGIVKTKRLWVFAREIATEQPRVFCFFEAIYEKFQKKSTLLYYYGHLMESAQDGGDNFLAIPVLLVTPEFDKRLWWSDNRNANYNDGEHWDIFPSGESEGDWRNRAPQLPRKVLDYLFLDKRL